MVSPALFASVSMALLPRAVPLDASRRLHVTRPALRCSSPAMLDPASAWAAYNSALVTDPLVTKAISAGVIIGAGDAAAEEVTSHEMTAAVDPISGKVHSQVYRASVPTPAAAGSAFEWRAETSEGLCAPSGGGYYAVAVV